ncbi:AI-2E family transporter [Microlunatus sp. Y2014]|uniref:AI-2E family transporter n=1 Tax=Microlunatus sp. Y2014 TaxID=3418488 RepID=UPI003DA71C43
MTDTPAGSAPADDGDDAVAAPTEAPAPAEPPAPSEAGGGSHALGSRPKHRDPHRRILPLHHRSPFGIGFMATLGAVLALALAQTAAIAQPVLVLIMLALFIALGLSPIVTWVTRLGAPRWLGVAGVVAIAIGFVALALWAIVPLATRQLSTLITDGPALIESTRNHPVIRDLDARFQFINKAADFLASPDLVNQLFGGVLGAGQVLINTLVSGVTLTVLTIYFLASLPSIKKAIYGLSPRSRRERMRYLADEIFDKVGSYLSGLFIIVTLAGTCSFVMLMLNGLGEYALALAVVVAMLTFIPLVGPTIGMVIVTTVAFINSPTQGIIALVYYILYTQTEAYLIYPRVMSRSVDVPGVVTITAALLGGTLLGIVGALIAVPIAAVVLLLWREVLVPKLEGT